MDDKPEAKKISYDYIRGLVEGEGCFTFSTSNRRLVDGSIVIIRIPSFVISMHERDQELLKLVRDTLKLKNRIYNYRPSDRDGHKRGRKATLIVREIGSIKNIIVPLFYGKLRGNKGKQFENWIENIGLDPCVPKNFKLIHQIYKNGFYDKNIDRFGFS